MTSAEEDTDNIGILGSDPGLEQYKDHFKYRVRKYAEQKALFEKYERGLEEFAQGDKFLLDMKIAIFFLSFLLPHRKLLISKHFLLLVVFHMGCRAYLVHMLSASDSFSLIIYWTL